MFSTQAPASADLGNMKPEEISTNQEAIPCPYIAGRARLGLHWISEIMNPRSTDVKQKVGKGGEQTVGQNHYGDIAGAVCLGPVDALRTIIIDKVPVWEGQLARGAENYGEVVVPEYGAFRIYWGTATQTRDTLVLDGETINEITITPETHPWEFAAAETAEEYGVASTLILPAGTKHPPYRHVCYVVCQQLFFGQGRTSVPNVEVIVERAPHPVGMSLPTDITRDGCNPASIIAEMLTSEVFGPGIASAKLDGATFASVAAKFAANPERYYLSPSITKQGSLRKWLSEMCAYFDGWLRVRAGKIQIGFFPHDGVVPTVTELSHHDMVNDPEAEYAAQDELITGVQVSYMDTARAMKEASEVAHSPGTRRMLGGDIRTQTYQRPWIITRQHARTWAEEAVQTGSVPLAAGSITVFGHKARNLDGSLIGAGDRFQLDYLPWELDLIVRVTQRVESKDGTVQLDWEQERGLFAMQYSAPDADEEPELLPVAAITEARVVVLPQRMSGSVRTTLGFVAARPAADVSGGRTHYAAPDMGGNYSYDLVNSRLAWGAVGKIDNAWDEIVPDPEMPGEAGRIEIDPDDDYLPVLAQITLDAGQQDMVLLQPQSGPAAMDNTLLMIVEDEITSVETVEVIAPGRYLVKVLRGRYGTATNSHAGGQRVWIVPRGALEESAVQHRDFAHSSLVYFKLQTKTLTQLQPLEDAYVLAIRLPYREPALPLILFDSSQPAIVTGVTSLITGTIEDPNEDIIQWGASVRDPSGGVQVVRNVMVAPTGHITFTVPVMVLSPGSVTVTVTAQDSEAGALGFSSASLTLEATGEDLLNKTFYDRWAQLDQYILESWGRAQAYIDDAITDARARVETLRKWLEEIEIESGKFASDYERNMIDIRNDAEWQRGELLRIGVVSANAMAGIEELRLTTVRDNQVLAERVDTMLAEMSTGWNDMLTGLASQVDYAKSEVQKVNTGLITLNNKYSVMETNVDNAMLGITQTNTYVDLVNQRVDTAAGNLTSLNTAVTSIQSQQGSDHAKVEKLAETFISNGEVKAIYSLRVDANGTVTGMDLVSTNAGGGTSLVRFSSEAFEVILGGRGYRLTQDQPVLQQVGGGKQGGDSTWRIRNAHIPIFIPQSGSWVGGGAEVKVYPDDGA